MSKQSPGNKFMNNQIVRFVLSAGAGFLVDISAYYLFYHNLLTEKTYQIFSFTVRNSSLSLFLSFFLGVLVNFVITRYFVFAESKLSPYKQFFRFITVAMVGFFANLVMLKFFIQQIHLYPPVARPLAALSLFFLSFFVHKFFSFNLSRQKKGESAIAS